jgi:ligand-binding SRPBCC domain-containing protein
LPLRWRTTIERFHPPHLFIDSQARGPYRAWWHEHRFRAEGRHTIMEDRVYYVLPFGWLGSLVHRWFVVGALRRIFGFRGDAVRLRFGVASAPLARDKRGAA